MSTNPIYVGTDVGASRTKVAVLDADRKLIGWAVKKSGTDFAATAQTCLELALKSGRGPGIGYSQIGVNRIRAQ